MSDCLNYSHIKPDGSGINPGGQPRSRLSVAVRAIALGLSIAALAPATALAQQTGTTQGSQRLNVDSAVGPLDTALNQLARTAGVSLAFDPALLESRKAPAVKGSLTFEEAIGQLLQGSGLEAAPKAGGGYQLQEASGQGDVTLKPVKVTAEPQGLGASTERTGSYTTGRVSTALRLSLSPRETPQTMTIVTRQKMDDFALADIDDVLESTSGVHVFDRGSNGAFYYSRGFEMQAQYDGLANPVGIGEWNMNPSPDSAFLDHVEVLQGPNGLLTGAGHPGGVVNLVRKRATTELQAQVEAQVGSWDKKRLVGDISGPLVDSGKVRGRAVAVWDETDSFVDYVFDDKKGFYGALDADLTDTTLLNASIQYQKNDGRNHGGVPMGPDGSDLHLKRSSFYGDADNSVKKEYLLTTVSIEQRLAADWLLKASYNDNRSEVDIQNGSFTTGGPLNVETGTGLRLNSSRYLERDFTSNAWDVYASGPLQLFGRTHELVAGANGVKMNEQSRNTAAPGIVGPSFTPINIYDFDPRAVPNAAGERAPLGPEDETKQHGIYGVARINLMDSLKVIAGTRVSWYEYVDTDGVKQSDEDAEISPYAGIIYDIDKNYSVYASYADIFTPQQEKNRNGNALKPIVGTNYEIGVKGEFYDGRLNAAMALFRLEQTNLATIDEEFAEDPNDVCGGTCYIAEDEIETKGVDITIDGELLTGWNIGGGYTYVSSEYASGELDGDPRLTEVPENLFRLYTTYRLPSLPLTIGGNINVQSRFYTEGVRNGIDWRVQQGGLATVGLMARYDVTSNTQVSFTADNIFDRRYFASTNSLYYVPYGEERKFAISAKYTFK